MTPPLPHDPPPPPACAQCLTTMQAHAPGSLPQQSSSQMMRSADGKMRVDFGHTSMITDPQSQKTIILDHIRKEAFTAPARPQTPQMTMPGMPAFPNSPVPPQVMELGKAIIDGHEVEGKQYTFQPPRLPQAPSAPRLPGMPHAPGMPQSPQAPPMPTTAEVWTSTKTKFPVLTKINGPYGQQICQCKTELTAEPNPAAFQVPADYKHVPALTPPKPPSLQPPPVEPPKPPGLKPPSLR